MLELADKDLKTPIKAMFKDIKESIICKQIVNLSSVIEQGLVSFS